MSEIILPPGRSPNPDENKPRPSNEQVLDFINKQVADQESQETADKIVNMGELAANAETLERRKKQLAVATQIVMTQLDADSKMLEASAMEKTTKLQECHDKMAMARALRMAMGWLQGLVATQQAVDNAKDQKPENQ